MNATIPKVLSGEALEQEIEAIEAFVHDEEIRRTIAARVAIANEEHTVFISDADVYAASHARLLKRLKGRGDA